MKKLVMSAIAVLLLFFLVYQGSTAYYHAQTSVGARVSAGRLGINIIETSEHANSTKTKNGYQYHSIMPGDIIDQAAYIENVKDKTLYVRVIAEKYWEDANGNKQSAADASFIQLYTDQPQDWIIIDDAENSNSEIVYFYYKKPIRANERSGNFVDAIKVKAELSDPAYTKYQMKLSYDAEAVQAIEAEDAVLSQWGMDIKLDAKGNIVSVDE